MRYLQSYSSFCKQYFGTSLPENHANISQNRVCFGETLGLDMDTAVRDSIRFAFIALKSVTAG